MIQQLDVPVSVTSRFDHRQRAFVPIEVTYEGQAHPITKIGYHHICREGRVLYHVFSVASPSVFFRLVLDTETLAWSLTEVHDGEVN